MPQILRLTPTQLDAVVGHARKCAPEEACGILAGVTDEGVGQVERVFLMQNSAHSATFYEMDSREQFQVFDQMRQDGLEPVAIFHSHPHSPAVPSQKDMELAFYPDSIYLIVSLAGAEPEPRAWRIASDEPVELEVKVVSDREIS